MCGGGLFEFSLVVWPPPAATSMTFYSGANSLLPGTKLTVRTTRHETTTFQDIIFYHKLYLLTLLTLD